MVTTTIKITGLKKVNKFLKELPQEIRKDFLEEGSLQIAKSGQRRIIRTYNLMGYGKGITSTGFGLRSLSKKMNKVKTENDVIYSIEIPGYLAMIEKGVASHYVSPNIIEAHMESPGSTIGKTAIQMGLAPPYSGKPFFWHWKGPFVSPAMKSLDKDIPRILEKVISKTILRLAR